MTIIPEIKKSIEKNMDLMLDQIEAYRPFLSVAFPGKTDLPEFCYNMMLGNAMTTFLSQFALRLQTPDAKDFAEFGLVVEPYRQKVKDLF